jgi:DNA-binding transcriptional LysR family regulator
MDLRQLRYFLEVAERLNISAAARSLRMTQPALSRQIRAFEETLGWDLLERGKKSIRLTRAGEVVQREGERVMKSVKQGLARMRQEIEGAEMRVGFAPSLVEGLIERAMARFTESFPKVRVSWFDCSTQEMWDKLGAGELDVILEVATNDRAIRWEKLLEKRVCLAVPMKHPLAKRRFIKPEHLDDERLLLLSRHEYPGYWEKVTDYFASHQVNAKIAGEFDGIASLRLGVEAGLGMAFVVEGAIVTPFIKMLPLKPAPDPICVSLGHASRRSLEPWERGFLEALQAR